MCLFVDNYLLPTLTQIIPVYGFGDVIVKIDTEKIMKDEN